MFRRNVMDSIHVVSGSFIGNYYFYKFIRKSFRPTFCINVYTTCMSP